MSDDTATGDPRQHDPTRPIERRDVWSAEASASLRGDGPFSVEQIDTIRARWDETKAEMRICGHPIDHEKDRFLATIERLTQENGNLHTKLDVAIEQEREIRGVTKARPDEITALAVRRAIGEGYTALDTLQKEAVRIMNSGIDMAAHASAKAMRDACSALAKSVATGPLTTRVGNVIAEAIDSLPLPPLS